jgi:uncharacterized delta-60 repeat protein
VLEDRINDGAKKQNVWSPFYVDDLIERDRDSNTSTSDGVLDTTFNSTGKFTTDNSGADDEATAVVALSNGETLAAGWSGNDFAVFKYNSNGTLDTGFGSSGKKTVDIGTSTTDKAYAMAVQSDGKIRTRTITRRVRCRRSTQATRGILYGDLHARVDITSMGVNMQRWPNSSCVFNLFCTMLRRVSISVGSVLLLIVGYGASPSDEQVMKELQQRHLMPVDPVSIALATPSDLRLSLVMTEPNAAERGSDERKIGALTCVCNVSGKPLRIYIPGFIGYICERDQIYLRGPSRYGAGEFVVLRPGAVYGRAVEANMLPKRTSISCCYEFYEPGREGQTSSITGRLYSNGIYEQTELGRTLSATRPSSRPGLKR